MTTASAIQSRKLGRTGPAVFPIALGCMGMSGMYGPADEPESLATIHAAIDAGVMTVDSVTVFYSTLGREGPTYEVLSRAELQG